MPLEPRSQSDVVETVESRLRGRIRKLTNFVGTSFNSVFLRSFATAISRYEMKLLSAQLSGWVDYAGAEITESDLSELGITVPDRELLNEFQSESDLEKLGTLVGVSRGSGIKATGSVTIQTARESTVIPEGMKVSTGPNATDTANIYRVDADQDGTITEDAGIVVTPPDGQTEVTLPVIAEDIGTEYNVGVGSVTFLPGPPPGVESVTNPVAIDGGENEQQLSDFRSDIKESVPASSGGGTVAGIEGRIKDEVETVNSVQINEQFDRDPVVVDVVVSGGDDSTVKSVIEDARPAGVKHRLVNPTSLQLGVTAYVNGTVSDTGSVADAIGSYISNQGLGEPVIGDKIIQTIMNTTPNIRNITSINTRIVDVAKERHTYGSGTSVYALNTQPLGDMTERRLYRSDVNTYRLSIDAIDTGSVSVTAPVNGTRTQLVQGTDYEIIENVGSDNDTRVDFSIGGDAPDMNSMWSVSYQATTVGPQSLSATVADTDVELTAGTDYDFIDADGDGFIDSIDFSIGGSNPDDGTPFVLSYKANTSFDTDLRIDDQNKAVADDTEITVLRND